MKRRNVSLWLVGVLLLVGLWVDTPFAREKPSVPEEYQKYFAHYVDQRSYMEKVLNAIGLTNQDIGRSFALIAGISSYPNLSEPNLKPAEEDLKKLEDYLKHVEFFDEIIVLKNEDMTLNNLVFFLQTYLPERLRTFPKSRCLFAYSGHGITEGSRGYLLLNTAESLSDKQHSINIELIRVLFSEVVDGGHHVLALINACYGGTFLNLQFGPQQRFIPRYRGAHAITAGGTNEVTWHDPKIGSGSIFFEKFFEGLNGYADALPEGGDGIVTVDELAAYLKQMVQVSTDQHQNPRAGDLVKGGSPGGFFFLNRHRQVEQGLMPPWPPEEGKTYGARSPQAQKVTQLLKKADAYFERQWYTTPEETNAFDVYREVLEIDPTNEHANRQIDWIADFYKSRAEKEERRGRIEQALQFYRKYLKVMPNDEDILDKVAELEEPLVTPTPTTQPPPKEPTPTEIPAPTAFPSSEGLGVGKAWTDPVTGMEFVWIEGGCFQMGQTEAEKRVLIKEVGEEDYKKYYADELPRHRVCVDGFWMGKYEVTNAQYRKFKQDHDSKDYGGHSLNDDDQPVVYVSWEDAKAFTEWLTQQHGGKYTFRLPTEAEWEYAVRAGTTTSRYWGDDPNDACRYANVHDQTSDKAFNWDRTPHDCNDGYAVTAPVGSFRSNEFGLYDMLGNIWEWCEDWYDGNYYANSPSNNPRGPSSGKSPLLRGGSWCDDPTHVRSAYRYVPHPVRRYYFIGFRVVVGASTLRGQSWRMGIRWVYRRRVQTCSGDRGNPVRKSTQIRRFGRPCRRTV